MNIFNPALALALLTLLACAPSYPHDPSLEAELAGRSKSEGLGILTTTPNTGTLPLMYFDQRSRQIKCCGKFSQSWVLPGGRQIITTDDSQMWLTPTDPTSWGPNVILFDLNGTEKRKFPLWIRANRVAVSPDGKMIAFRGQGGPPPSSGGLQLDRGLLFGHLDTPVFQKIYSITEGGDPRGWVGGEQPETFAWSKDATEIVYGKDGTIYDYNLAQDTSRPLAKGSNPLWSPDGTWISYRGPDGEAMLVDPAGKKSRKLLPGKKIAYALHWSPDGHYLLLTLSSEDAGVRWLQTAVYRLSDGAMTAIAEPGIAGDDSGKEWVVTGQGH